MIPYLFLTFRLSCSHDDYKIVEMSKINMVSLFGISVSRNVGNIYAITLGEATTWNIRRTFARNVGVSFRIFQVVASPKVIASCYPRLPTLAPIGQENIHGFTFWSFRCFVFYWNTQWFVIPNRLFTMHKSIERWKRDKRGYPFLVCLLK